MTNEKRGKQAFFDTDRFSAQEVQKMGVDEVAPATEEQAADFTPKVEFGATQGKKGHKIPRINMGFSPENHEWVKSRSKQLGISATEFVNAILERERLKD